MHASMIVVVVYYFIGARLRRYHIDACIAADVDVEWEDDDKHAQIVLQCIRARTPAFL
jgi:hypothetical protein